MAQRGEAARSISADAAMDNPVSLKVMRLCKPTFGFKLPVPYASGSDTAMESSVSDVPDEVREAGHSVDERDSLPVSAISGMLMLPQSFGDIFLGETFSCYISLTNIAPFQLAQMGLKVEVQTQLHRETLSDSSLPEGDSLQQFMPQQTLDRIIRYELKDLGIHILICSALYTDSLGERKYFRKFFKFQVQNPLSMKSKTHSLPLQNEILVETQLQNATQRPLFLQSVSFIPALEFEVQALTDFDAAVTEPVASATVAAEKTTLSTATLARPLPVGLPVFGRMAYLKAGDTQQHMYRLRGKQPSSVLRSVSALGRMEVVWKAQMGESGHLQSNTVQRKLPSSAARAVEVDVLASPQRVVVETPFEITCSIHNTTAKERALAIRYLSRPEETSGIVFDGVSGRSLGVLKPHSSQTVTLTLIALEPGMQKISGMQLIDSLGEEPIDVGPIVDVLVVGP